MKKLVITGFALLLALLASCSEPKETLTIGVSFYPMPQIVDLLADDLLEHGIVLEKMTFLNYAEANPALKFGEVDGNMIQHKFYMEVFNNAQDANLVIAQPIYHSIFTLFSGHYTSLSDIVDGEDVIIPNDGVNTARALLLLQSAGLITLASGKVFDATVDDVVTNNKNLNFVLSSLTASAGLYDEGGRKLAVMYPTFALNLELEGDAERLYTEVLNATTEQYAISFATRADNLEDPRIQLFIEYLTSDKVRTWLETNYGWAAIPAF